MHVTMRPTHVLEVNALAVKFPYLDMLLIACTPPLVQCFNVCVDTSTDPSFCGGCGHECQENEDCNNGVCVPTDTGMMSFIKLLILVCPPGHITCPGFDCIDTKTNNEHCGKCGTKCQTNYQCVGGTCLPPCPFVCYPGMHTAVIFKTVDETQPPPPPPPPPSNNTNDTLPCDPVCEENFHCVEGSCYPVVSM